MTIRKVGVAAGLVAAVVAVVLLANGDEIDRQTTGAVVLPSESGSPAPSPDLAEPWCTTGRLEWRCVEWAIQGNFSEPFVRDGTIVTSDTDERLIGIDPATGTVRWRLHEPSLRGVRVESYNDHLVVIQIPDGDVILVDAGSGRTVAHGQTSLARVTPDAVMLRRQTDTTSALLLIEPSTGRVASRFDVEPDERVWHLGDVIITADSQQSQARVRDLQGNVLWTLDPQRDLPVALGDHVYIHGTAPDGSETLRAVTTETGAMVWELPIDQVDWETRLVQGVLILDTVERDREIIGLDAATGRELWRRPAGDGDLQVVGDRLWLKTRIPASDEAALARIKATTGVDRWVIPLNVTATDPWIYDRVLRFNDRIAGAGLDGFYVAHADGSRQQFTLDTTTPSSESRFLLLDPPVVAAGDWLYGLNPAVLTPLG